MHKANKPNAPVAALSSKLQGLKFMQRGNNAASTPTIPTSSALASTNQTDSRADISVASSPSASASSAALSGNVFAPLAASGPSSAREPSTRYQQGAAVARPRTDGTEDGNEEHWVISSRSIPAQDVEAGSLPSTAAAYQGLAWNDWLISQDEGRAGRDGKRKASVDLEDDDDRDVQRADQLKREQQQQHSGAQDGPDDQAVSKMVSAPSGRRRFGAWAPPRKQRKSEQADEREIEIVSGKKVKEEPSTHSRFNGLLGRKQGKR